MLTALCALSAGLCGALAAVRPGAPAEDALHVALTRLEKGQFEQAERIARGLAANPASPTPKAWLIVAAACERQRRYADAAQAYRKFLPSCDSTSLRAYALDRIDSCRSESQSKAPAAPPSRRLTERQLRNLNIIDRVTYIESTSHFVVRCRNATLAKLLANEAEIALDRICRDLLGGQEFPHTVHIFVWANHEEYVANAAGSAPDWSDGNFSVTYSGDLPIRRIDLTQTDNQGRFSLVMLDRVLPHEMCHLVLKEFFGDAACPLALNEGLAMLAEAQVDNRRVILAGQALSGKVKIPVDKLLAADLGDLESKAVFYAESFSFLDYLHGRMTREQFKAFLDHVKAGCEVVEAIQRALVLPNDGAFLPALAAAWEDQAVADWQILEALSAK